MRMSLRPLVAAAVMAGALGVSASSASAAAPTGDYVNFKNCPYTNTAVDVVSVLEGDVGIVQAGECERADHGVDAGGLPGRVLG